MHTQKRNKDEHAFKLGFNSGIRGHSMEFCSYTIAEARGAWFGGWREGRSQYLAGYVYASPALNESLQTL